LKILHTADWHIGLLIHEYDRIYEHQQFLNWLLGKLINEHIYVFLINGDVFDLSNPSAASVKMSYSFLNQTVKANYDLQIIINAQNNDSASRLECPKTLFGSSNIHIIGLVEKKRVNLLHFHYYENATSREQYQDLLEQNLQPF
jgi:exonuclease SbcD